MSYHSVPLDEEDITQLFDDSPQENCPKDLAFRSRLLGSDEEDTVSHSSCDNFFAKTPPKSKSTALKGSLLTLLNSGDSTDEKTENPPKMTSTVVPRAQSTLKNAKITSVLVKSRTNTNIPPKPLQISTITSPKPQQSTIKSQPPRSNSLISMTSSDEETTPPTAAATTQTPPPHVPRPSQSHALTPLGRVLSRNQSLRAGSLHSANTPHSQNPTQSPQKRTPHVSPHKIKQIGAVPSTPLLNLPLPNNSPACIRVQPLAQSPQNPINSPKRIHTDQISSVLEQNRPNDDQEVDLFDFDRMFADFDADRQKELQAYSNTEHHGHIESTTPYNCGNTHENDNFESITPTVTPTGGTSIFNRHDIHNEREEDEDEMVQCPICYDTIFTPTMSTSCTHIFCKMCISAWTDNDSSCPVCKQRVFALHTYELAAWMKYISNIDFSQIGNLSDTGERLTEEYLSGLIETTPERAGIISFAHNPPPPQPIETKAVQLRVQNQYNEDMSFNPQATALENTVCFVCGGIEEDEGNDMLLCDGDNALCTNGCHFNCLNPVFFEVPENQWYCPMHCEQQRINPIQEWFLSISPAYRESLTNPTQSPRPGFPALLTLKIVNEKIQELQHLEDVHYSGAKLDKKKLCSTSRDFYTEEMIQRCNTSRIGNFYTLQAQREEILELQWAQEHPEEAMLLSRQRRANRTVVYIDSDSDSESDACHYTQKRAITERQKAIERKNAENKINNKKQSNKKRKYASTTESSECESMFTSDDDDSDDELSSTKYALSTRSRRKKSDKKITKLTKKQKISRRNTAIIDTSDEEDEEQTFDLFAKKTSKLSTTANVGTFDTLFGVESPQKLKNHNKTNLNNNNSKTTKQSNWLQQKQEAPLQGPGGSLMRTQQKNQHLNRLKPLANEPPAHPNYAVNHAISSAHSTAVKQGVIKGLPFSTKPPAESEKPAVDPNQRARGVNQYRLMMQRHTKGRIQQDTVIDNSDLQDKIRAQKQATPTKIPPNSSQWYQNKPSHTINPNGNEYMGNNHYLHNDEKFSEKHKSLQNINNYQNPSQTTTTTTSSSYPSTSSPSPFDSNVQVPFNPLNSMNPPPPSSVSTKSGKGGLYAKKHPVAAASVGGIPVTSLFFNPHAPQIQTQARNDPRNVISSNPSIAPTRPSIVAIHERIHSPLSIHHKNVHPSKNNQSNIDNTGANIHTGSRELDQLVNSAKITGNSSATTSSSIPINGFPPRAPANQFSSANVHVINHFGSTSTQNQQPHQQQNLSQPHTSQTRISLFNSNTNNNSLGTSSRGSQQLPNSPQMNSQNNSSHGSQQNRFDSNASNFFSGSSHGKIPPLFNRSTQQNRPNDFNNITSGGKPQYSAQNGQAIQQQLMMNGSMQLSQQSNQNLGQPRYTSGFSSGTNQSSGVLRRP